MSTSTGQLRPWIVEAEIVRNALRAGATAAALDLLQGIPTSPPEARAWREYYAGLAAQAAGDQGAAEAAWLRSAAIAERRAEVLEAAGAPEAGRTFRLAALAYLRLGEQYGSEVLERRAVHIKRFGTGYVRRPTQRRAIEALLASYSHRMAHGSWLERWETAAALVGAYTRTRQHDKALRWCMTTIEAAEHLPGDEAQKRLCRSWGLLSRLHSGLGHPDEAIAAAQNAERCALMSGSPELLGRSTESLADTTASLALSLLGTDESTGQQRVREAWEHFRAASASYEAAGKSDAADACRERMHELEALLGASAGS